MADNQRDQQQGNQRQGVGGQQQEDQAQRGQRQDESSNTGDRDRTQAREQENRDAGQGGQVGGPNQRDTRDSTRENR